MMTVKTINVTNHKGETTFSYDYFLDTTARCTCGTKFEMNPDKLVSTPCPNCGKYHMWYNDDIISNEDYSAAFYYDDEEEEF